MSWNYHAETGSQASDAINNINSWVNENQSGYCAKFSAADMKGKDARAVVFYSNNKLAAPKNEPEPGTLWAKMKHSTNSNYELLYSQTVNSLNELTEVQQFYCSVVFTNAASHDALIEIIYPADM